MYKFCKYIFFNLFVLSVFYFCIDLKTYAQEKIPFSSIRLDAPITSENSFIFDFGYGGVFKIQKILESSLDFDHIKQPVKAEGISFVFMYPDMTLTNWTSQMDIIFQKERKIYIPQKDRFPVYIPFMFYSPGNMGFAELGERKVRDGRPPRLELNRHCYKKANGSCDYLMLRIPSNVPETDILISKHWAKKHPESLIHNPKNETSYVDKPNSPFELLLDCDAPTSTQCRGYVYSKKHHFQYRIIFPPEAAIHADEVIRAIEKIMDQWIPSIISEQH